MNNANISFLECHLYCGTETNCSAVGLFLWIVKIKSFPASLCEWCI